MDNQAKLTAINERMPFLNDALSVAVRSNDDAKILEARRALNDCACEKSLIEEEIKVAALEAQRARKNDQPYPGTKN